MNFPCSFTSIGHTIAKIRPETFFCGLANRFFGIYSNFLSTFVVILPQSDIPLKSYRRKCSIASIETGFTVVAALFWPLWFIFCVVRTYHCQDTGEKLSSWALKRFYSIHWSFCALCIYSAPNRHIVTKVRTETFLCMHWNWFYGINISFSSTLVAILH